KNSVKQISVTSANFTTPEGLSTSSSLADVEKYYQSLKKNSYFVHGSGGGLVNYYDDIDKGIAFEFSAADSPQPEFKAYAIIVHRAGESVTPEPDEEPR